MARGRGTRGARAPLKIDLALQGGGAHGAFTWGVLDRLLEDAAFRKQIAAIKVWATDGRLLYARDKSQIGRRYPITHAFRTA